MGSLRAFVGHSFTPEDEQVVGKFLKYFDSIQEINPDFSWEHAEHAEPAAIDEKVLRLFQDKNIFIGICTRKERVVQPEKLKKGVLKPSTLNADAEDFSWKTSDWVIQEIGLAFGREMKVIILLEEGVRTPGGIQGSLEYILFNRDTPEKSYGKLLQMIASLSPQAENVGGSESSAAKEPDENKSEKVVDTWLTPNHAWTRRSYELAYMHLIAIGDGEAAEKIQGAFLQSPLASVALKELWDAFAEHIRLRFGQGGSIDKLRTLAATHASSAGILKYLAQSYEDLGEDTKAAETFIEAANLESDAREKIEILGSAIDCAAKKDPILAERLLRQAKDIANGDPSLRTIILTIENSFSKARKENGFMFSAMERFLEEMPDDHSKRFDLAYAYGEAGLNDMSLFHYQRIPYGARWDSVWNNLGVAYENLKLPVKSIASYQKAKELGSTLAMSNMAYRFMNAGFLEQARAICEEAVQTPEHHKNVDTALAKVKEVGDAEAESEAKVISSAQSISEFHREVGAALIAQPMNDFDEEWIYEGERLKVILNQGKFSAHGFVEENVVGLRRIAFGDAKPEQMEITFSGLVRGRAVLGTFERKRKGGATLMALYGSDDKENIVMYFSAAGDSIEILMGHGEKQKKNRIFRAPPSSNDLSARKAG